jgi:hypothetical protein
MRTRRVWRKDVPLGRIVVGRRCCRVVRRAAKAERGFDLLDRGVLQAGRLEELLQRLEVGAEVAQREVAAEATLAQMHDARRKETYRSGASSSVAGAVELSAAPPSPSAASIFWIAASSRPEDFRNASSS